MTILDTSKVRSLGCKPGKICSNPEWGQRCTIFIEIYLPDRNLLDGHDISTVNGLDFQQREIKHMQVTPPIPHLYFNILRAEKYSSNDLIPLWKRRWKLQSREPHGDESQTGSWGGSSWWSGQLRQRWWQWWWLYSKMGRWEKLSGVAIMITLSQAQVLTFSRVEVQQS